MGRGNRRRAGEAGKAACHMGGADTEEGMKAGKRADMGGMEAGRAACRTGVGRALAGKAGRMGRAAAGDRAGTPERADMKVGMRAGKGGIKTGTAETAGMAEREGRAVWAVVRGRGGPV